MIYSQCPQKKIAASLTSLTVIEPAASSKASLTGGNAVTAFAPTAPAPATAPATAPKEVSSPKATESLLVFRCVDMMFSFTIFHLLMPAI